MFSHTVSRQKQNAFTLIELLVVIAIIAILAAILFPVFAQARAKARQTACLSNEKQIGTGLMMYIQDNDECFPTRSWRGGTGYCFDPSTLGAPTGTSNPYCTQYNWPYQLMPYTRSTAILVCPSDTNPTRATNANANANHYAVPVPLSYAVNSLLYVYPLGDDPGYENNGPIPLAQVAQPASTYFLADGANLGFDNNWMDRVRFANVAASSTILQTPCTATTTNPYTSTTLTTTPSVNTPKNYRHNGGSVILFADGHSAWRTYTRLSCWNGTYANEGPNP